MKSAVLICCSALQDEAEQLCTSHWPDLKRTYVTSTLHLHPERLAATLQSALEAELKQGNRVVLIYGDCCARMTALESLPGVVRTRAKNCCELLLGAEEYRRLSHEGAFFVIPKWARRWKRFFSGLGLNRDNAASLMQDLHRSLLYLDTGLAAVPDKSLQECAEYCGLPFEVRQVSLDYFHGTIEDALLRSRSSAAAG
ncbi:MAG: DUF1638 domain-containing protein [Pelobacteraceae bacterium]